MHLLVLLWALLAAPFWESKAPRDWTDRELLGMLSNSPWARPATAEGAVRLPDVSTYLASALPMQEAEAEAIRRGRITLSPESEDFREFLRKQKGESIVLTVAYPDPDKLADGREATRM